jgi:hypothetical protein
MCWWIIASIHPAWRYPQLYTQRIVLSTTVGKKPDAIHNYPPCMLYTVFGATNTATIDNAKLLLKQLLLQLPSTMITTTTTI